MHLGRTLKLIRASRGMTQKKMADILGISQNYLSLIESNKKNPSTDKISEFAKKMGFSADALTFIISNPPKELNEEDRKKYTRLQNNINSLILFELSGEMKKIA